MSEDAERAARLERAAHALETRRRACAIRDAQMARAQEAARAREGEMVELMTALAGETRVVASATRRLAALQRELAALTRERERLRESMRRDRRVAHGAEKAAARLAESAARAQERAALEAWIDQAFSRSKP